MACKMSPGGGVPLVGPQEERKGSATRPEWIYSQGFYFESRAGGGVRIFGFYNNKQRRGKKGDALISPSLFVVIKFTPVSLGYPQSVFNKNSTLKQTNRQSTRDQICGVGSFSQRCSFPLPFGQWHSQMVRDSLRVCHVP